MTDSQQCKNYNLMNYAHSKLYNQYVNNKTLSL